MHTTHADRPLEFLDTHRPDEAVQPTLIDALDDVTTRAARTITTGAPLGDHDPTVCRCACHLTTPPKPGHVCLPEHVSGCGCRGVDHEAMCPANPDPSVCDVCREPYDPDTVQADLDCPGGHCADEACRCYPCSRPRARYTAYACD